MDMKHWWQQKIVALLHDPPDKALKIAEHKSRASVLMQFALRGLPDVPPTGVPPSEWEDNAKQGDTIAAAADRLNFPQEVQVLDWAQKENSVLCHPLSGQTFFVLLPDETNLPEQTQSAQAKAVKQLAQSTQDPKQRFLLLWRFLPEELKRELPLGWELLPADTRLPEHSLLHHARVTSAIAASLPHPTTLLFSIGPVQGFIAAARKTRDLWMGSFLLSYLTWSAIKVVAEEFGPDHVLYPSLLKQPLVDHWLQQTVNIPEGLSKLRALEQLRLATFPNRSMAVVPAEQAGEIAQEVEKAVREEWERLAELVWQELCAKVPGFCAARPIWERHILQFPEVYWAIYRWEADVTKAEEEYRQLTGSECFREWMRTAQGKHPLNTGALYAAYCELTDKALGARKALRDLTLVEEPFSKCSLCGERRVLSDLTDFTDPPSDWTQREKDFWKAIAQAFPGDVAPDGRERLCAICTVKRFVAKAVFGKRLLISAAFPSTDSIAAASFVLRLFECWEKVRDDAEKLLEQIEAAGLKDVAFVEMDIPKLNRKAQQLEDQVASKLLELDGEWLFAESYERSRVEYQHRISVNEESVRNLQRLLREMQGKVQASPNDYYAVLLMDGDEMGKWLSGTHPALPRYHALLHPEARKQLEQLSDPGWQSVLDTPRLISPSLHGAISEVLANFALNYVPFVVEERYSGRLIYAGGDDVLALLPLQDALPAARELRGFFSGGAERLPNGQVSAEFGSSRWSGWLNWNGQALLTMGNKATASIGIVIAHRLHPLRDVLRQARQTEEDAKELYGRNAICVRWLKRSGEQVQMGAKFSYPEDCVKDTLQFLLSTAEKMGQEGPIARGFATDLMQESWVLAELLPEAQKAEVKRLLKRRKKGDMAEGEVEQIAEQLVKLAQALHSHADEGAEPYELTRPQRGLVELAKWLTLLRFLSGGGE